MFSAFVPRVKQILIRLGKLRKNRHLEHLKNEV